jgi:hypothetical protein
MHGSENVKFRAGLKRRPNCYLKVLALNKLLSTNCPVGYKMGKFVFTILYHNDKILGIMSIIKSVF